MNCKPGDLAMVVAPYHPNGRGHFVAVERLASVMEHLEGRQYLSSCFYGEIWVCSGAVPDDHGRVQRLAVIADICLRPIRPGETPEESITAMDNLLRFPTEQIKSMIVDEVPSERTPA